MSNSNKPTLGPIFGYRQYNDSDASQKILVRGKPKVENQVCHIFIREIGGDFTMDKHEAIRNDTVINGHESNYDHTVEFDLKGLPLDTKFEYKVAITEKGMPVPTFDSLKGYHCYTGRFETRNKNDSITSFVFGSCCHFPIIKINQSDDAAFETMLKQWNENVANDDFLLMLGDQIYGDHVAHDSALGFLPAKNKVKKLSHFLKHYRIAFAKKYKRAVMASIPTYMIFDDHEVHNDWGTERFFDKGKLHRNYKALENGLNAYNIYQVSHPDIKTADPNLIKKGSKLPASKYYYQFTHGKSGFFIMDTRYYKVPLKKDGSNKGKAQMISPAQMKDLKVFLKSKKHKVKFVGTGVPMWPDSKKNRPKPQDCIDRDPEDRWEGHVRQRKEILDFIHTNQIRNVFFLSGDVHVSYASNLIHNESKAVVARQITSSAFNWGIGLNDSYFSKNKILRGTDGLYKPKDITGPVITVDNFCRVEVKTSRIDIKFHHAKTGKCLFPHSFELD